MRVVPSAGLAVLLLSAPFGGAAAGSASLFGGDALMRSSAAPVEVAYLQPEEAAPVRGSLFTGRARASLFAPLPERKTVTPPPPAAALEAPQSVAGHIRDLIAQAEAGRDGYDAVQHGARVRPSKRPTDMTLGEIYAWIKATPRQPHAIGRYQFIPPTLRRLAREAGLGPEVRFSPEVQDRLADILLAEAGLHEATAGRIAPAAFMHGLAKIWAGLPTASGKSYYQGHAGNKATISRKKFQTAIEAILAG